jgi:hypothetical protein
MYFGEPLPHSSDVSMDAGQADEVASNNEATDPAVCSQYSVMFIDLLENLVYRSRKVISYLKGNDVLDEYQKFFVDIESLLGMEINEELFSNIQSNRYDRVKNNTLDNAIVVARFLVERRQFGQSEARSKYDKIAVNERRNYDIMKSVCFGTLEFGRISAAEQRNIQENYDVYKHSGCTTLADLKRVEAREELEECLDLWVSTMCGVCQRWGKKLERKVTILDEDGDEEIIFTCSFCGNGKFL